MADQLSRCPPTLAWNTGCALWIPAPQGTHNAQPVRRCGRKLSDLRREHSGRCSGGGLYRIAWRALIPRVQKGPAPSAQVYAAPWGGISVSGTGQQSPAIWRCSRCGALVHPSDDHAPVAFCPRCRRITGSIRDGG
jgi:hypothetical protein